jgi:oligoribonuclease NrnB/cAMP/cGMP phosphodiesterase (DHH superfamily)
MSDRHPLVIYHDSCIDGFCSAWVARRHFSLLGVDPVFVAASYGQPPPDVVGRDVYVLDFHYDRATTERMISDASSFRLLDHHASAIEPLRGLEQCTLDVSRSGAGMTWDYFFGPSIEPSKRPWLVDYVEDRDLWRFKLRDSQLINRFISVLPFDFDRWDEESIYPPDAETLRICRFIELKTERYIEETLRDVTIGRIDDYVVPIVTAPKHDVSEMLHALLSRSISPFVAAWRQRADGKFEYSFRSIGEFDVSKIAQKYPGGGGHRNSAGFVSDRMVHL